MKIILIVLFSFITLNAQNLLLFYDDAGVTVDAEAQAYFDALSTPLSENRQDTINQFVLMLKDSLSITNLSDFFLRLNLDANETEESSLTGLVYPDSATTEGGSLAWAVDVGWTGSTNVANHLNSHFNPATDAIIGGQDDISYGITLATNLNGVGYALGAVGTQYVLFRPRNSGSSATYINNKNLSAQAGITTSIGHHIITRTGASTGAGYVNGTVSTTISTTSVAASDIDIYFLASNGIGGLAWVERARFISIGVTQEQARKITNCIEWYLDAIGAGIIP